MSDTREFIELLESKKTLLTVNKMQLHSIENQLKSMYSYEEELILQLTQIKQEIKEQQELFFYQNNLLINDYNDIKEIMEMHLLQIKS